MCQSWQPDAYATEEAVLLQQQCTAWQFAFGLCLASTTNRPIYSTVFCRHVQIGVSKMQCT